MIQRFFIEKAIAITLFCLIAIAGLWYSFPQKRYDPMVLGHYWQYVWAYKAVIINDWQHIDRYIPKTVFFTNIVSFIFLILFVVLPKRNKERYGGAKWAGISDILKMNIYEKEGVILGKLGTKFLKTKEPLSVLLLAPPGTGKTAGYVIPNTLSIQHSIVVHDLKGEIYDTTAQHRRKFSKVYLFDPTSKESAVYNVFGKSALPKEQSDLSSYIASIANVLFKPQKGDAKFFVDEARSAFCFLAEYLICRDESTSLPEVTSLALEDKNTVKTFEKIIQELEERKASPYLIRKGNGVLMNAQSEKQWAGIMGTLKSELEVFNDPLISKATKGISSFSPQDLRTSSTSIYLKVRDKDKERLSPVVSMVMESLSRYYLSEMPQKNDQAITFILDEFIRLGRIDPIIEMPSVGRGYKLNAIFIAQDLEQVAKVYSREDLSTIESNTAYKIILQQNNFMTAERFSKLIGNETSTRISTSRNSNTKLLHANQNKSFSDEGLPLVRPEVILNLKEGEAILLVKGYFNRPIKTKIPYFFEDRSLKKLTQEAA
jgi:type IV secretion system protein VirD4